MKRKITLTLTLLMLTLVMVNSVNMQYPSQTDHQDNGLYQEDTSNLLRYSGTFYGLQSNLTSTMNISLTTGVKDASTPNIAVNSSNVIHVVWQEDDGSDSDIWYSTYDSENHAGGWTVPFRISGSDSNDDLEPDIYIDGNDDVHVVWRDDDGGGNYFIKYRNKTISGWNAEETVYTHASRDQQIPVIAANDAGKKMVVWMEYDPGPPIYHIYSRVFQGDLAGNTRNSVATSTDYYQDPKITCDSTGTFHIVYCNITGGGDYSIVYCNYTSSLSRKYYLTDEVGSSTQSSFPDISTKGNMIVACWSDELGGSDFQIIYRNKTRTGAWKDYRTLTASSGYDNYHPRVELDSQGKLWALWTEDNALSDDEIVLKTPLEQKRTLTYAGTSTTDGVNARSSIVINSYDSILCCWDSSRQKDVLLKKLDRYGPHLNVIYPVNGTLYENTVDLNVTVVDFDFANISYYYWNDTNKDGIVNQADGSKWKKIYTTTDYSLSNYTWSVHNLNIPQAIIRIRAFDLNYLTETIYRRILIDDKDPFRSKIIDVTDGLNHNTSAPHNDQRFTGNISIRFNVSDDNSGIDKVELFSTQTGSTVLASNTSVDVPIGKILLNTSKILDGTYNFFIRTYDRTGNFNNSATTAGLIIDNTLPNATLKITEDSEVTNGDVIEVDLSGHPDTVRVDYFYHLDGDSSNIYSLGSDTNGADGWNYTVNIGVTYGRIRFIVNATDSTDLVGSAKVYIIVDNSPPVLNVETTLTQVGFSANVKVVFQKESGAGIDTITIAAFYKKAGAVKGTYKSAANITDVTSYITAHPNYELATSYYVILQCEFFQIEADWTAIDLLFKARDNKGLKSEKAVTSIQIIKDYPEDLTTITYDVKKYNITLRWEKSDDADEYIIYQSRVNLYTEFDMDSFNLYNVTERISFLKANLGFEIGEKYCIARISFSTSQNATYKITVNGPNTFYYVLIPLKSGNPGKAIYTSVTVNAENPLERSYQPNQAELWIYFFLIFLGLSITIYFVQVKKIKVKFFQSKVAVETKKIMDKEVVSFDKTQLDLDSFTPREEVITAKKKEKKLVKEPAVVSTTFDIPSLLEEKEATFEELPKKDTIDKCPTCGWILSSTAKKCPRCNWVRQ